MPVDINVAFVSNDEAVSLFKDYADAIFSNSLKEIADKLEPKFY